LRGKLGIVLPQVDALGLESNPHLPEQCSFCNSVISLKLDRNEDKNVVTRFSSALVFYRSTPTHEFDGQTHTSAVKHHHHQERVFRLGPFMWSRRTLEFRVGEILVFEILDFDFGLLSGVDILNIFPIHRFKHIIYGQVQG
jgi:hypothetical protein